MFLSFHKKPRLFIAVLSVLTILAVGFGCSSGSFSFSLNINNIDPDSGSVAGGTVVILTIKTSNADEGNTTVFFGVNAASVDDVTDVGGGEFQVTVTTPAANVAETVNVTVNVNNKENTAANAYTYQNTFLLVSNARNKTISFFGQQANGVVPPFRSLTLEEEPISVCATDNEIWVATDERVLVYPVNNKNSKSPLRIIEGMASQVHRPYLYLDKENKLVYMAHSRMNNKGLDGISVFSWDAEGYAIPKYQTLLSNNSEVAGFFVDTENQEMYVSLQAHSRVEVYSCKKGNMGAPLRIIAGDKTTLQSPAGIFVDKSRNEIFITDPQQNQIVVFDRLGNGDIHPKRVIAGSNTELSKPDSVFVDAQQKFIYVANSQGNSITVYKSDATGDVAPVRKLGGLASPNAVYVSGLKSE